MVWLTRRPRVLFYHPAGSSRSAIYRDMVLLSILRPLFPTVVFHLHARGLTSACDGLPRALRRVARRAYARPDFLLGPSKAIVEEASSLDAREARVVPNGTPSGRPHIGDDPSCRVEILFLNLISEAKGAGWLLRAFAELRAAGVDAHLTFAGECKPGSYQAMLVEQARSLGVTDDLTFAGLKIGDEKWRALESCDIFCVPTTWPQESFGLALVEAASCGLAVVAADVPGVREVLDPNVSIMLADPDDPASLGRILIQLCRSPELRGQMGDAARRAYEDRYTLERYWRDLDDLFKVVGEVAYACA
jgi:glycosyltransferase involved in cell wall biosynthesis